MNRDTHEMLNRLEKLGISSDDAYALRRIAMTLHRWHKLRCGVGNGVIERSESTGTPYWHRHNHSYLDPHDPRARYRIPDREAGAKRRLAAIMGRYPSLSAYIQTDPRGAALYILRPGDVPEGGDINCYYSRGIAVYK